MSFLLKNDCYISYKYEILGIVHLCWSDLINKQHRTELWELASLLRTSAICTYPQWGLSWVERATWLLLIPFWHVANYNVSRTSHFMSISSSSPFREHHISAPWTFQCDASWTKSSWLTGASFNKPTARTQQHQRHQVVHCNVYQCSHQQYNPGRTLINGQQTWKQ